MRVAAEAAAAESPAGSSPALGEGLPTPPTHGPQVFSEPPARSRASPTWATGGR